MNKYLLCFTSEMVYIEKWNCGKTQKQWDRKEWKISDGCYFI